jgi:hypothetical protein
MEGGYTIVAPWPSRPPASATSMPEVRNGITATLRAGAC